MSDSLIPMVHFLGCGGVAFLAEGAVIGGMPDHTKIVLLDGSRPPAGTLMICGSCGKRVRPSDIVPKREV